MTRRILSLFALSACTVFAIAPAGAQPPPQFKTGRVAPTLGQFAALKASSLEAHKSLIDGIPEAKESKWDSRTKGWIPEVKNQGNCGSCWDFSGTVVFEVALIKSKVLPREKAVFSEQYTLDCYENGGCSGDDNTTVLKHAKKAGIPTTADYGAYSAHEGRCRSDSKMKLHKIDDWAFADNDAGYESVGSTQKIKNGIKAFGIVGCAIAADNRFMNVRPGEVFRGNDRGINHDVALIGWDDTLVQNKTVWILRNSWGTGWCDGGYCLILEGANRVGTEPVVATVKSDEPDPEPVPPGPNPAPAAPFDWRAFMLGGLTVGIVCMTAVFVFSRRKA